MNERFLQLLGGDERHYPVELEKRYPRIFQRVLDLWGHKELDSYLDDLMIDERGDRAGFPPEVATEIIHLGLLHHTRMQPVQHRPDIWEDASPANREVHEVGAHAFFHKSLIEAAEIGNLEALNQLLNRGNPVDMHDERHWTPLIAAACNGHDEVVLQLIRHGAHLDTRDKSGYGALHWAAYNGKSGAVKILLDTHVDPNSRSHTGWTPLMQAASRGHAAIVAQLVHHGADVNLVSQDGATALHRAAAKGHLEVVRRLLASHADHTLRNVNGESAKDLALKNNHPQVAALIG